MNSAETQTAVATTTGSVLHDQNTAAVAWVVGSLLDGDPTRTADLFVLPGEVQFLAHQLLRTAARAALHSGGVEVTSFLSALCGTWNSWITDVGAEVETGV